jgi:predicted glycoside hydrolase/deacetylase ChbG (UPF0249 family)
MIRIVTRGDDAGCAVSANKAIHDACVQGILRNISLMANTPQIEDAARRLAGLKDVCFGMHISLTAEWKNPRFYPVLPKVQVSSLTLDDGSFPQTSQKLNDLKPRPEEADREVRAQLRRLRDLGFDVRYMDEHMAIGWISGFTEVFQQIAREEKLIFRPKVDRLPDDGGKVQDHDYASRLIARLRLAGPGTYLQVGHPTYNDAEMAEVVMDAGDQSVRGVVARDRDGQRLQFMREDVLALFRERDIRPIHYSDI